MKTTIEMPDGLYRRAKAEAALRGCKFRELIAEGVELALERPREPPRPPGLATLMHRGRGIIDSGIPDLASNPAHLVDFGSNVRDR